MDLERHLVEPRAETKAGTRAVAMAAQKVEQMAVATGIPSADWTAA
jgi:hypothetical protein